MKNRWLIRILVLFFMISSSSELLAQRVKMDIGVGRKTTVRDWNKDKNVSDFMYNDAVNLSTSISFSVKQNWGVWGRIAFDIYNKSNNNGVQNGFKIHAFDPDKYYLKDIADNGSPTSYSYELSAGAFYNIKYKKWRFMPILGIGISGTTFGCISFVLKEKDSNNAYKIDYNNSYKDDYLSTGFAEVGVNVNYNISKRFYLGAGLRLQQYFSGKDFHVSVYDYYEGLLIEERTYNGQAPMILQTELRFGLSF